MAHEFDVVRYGSQRYFTTLNKIQHSRKSLLKIVKSDSLNFISDAQL